jgi:FAD:protein FMN transferase
MTGTVVSTADRLRLAANESVETEIVAMGTICHVVIVGGKRSSPDLLQHVCTRINDLEQLWSRFLAESDISRINANAGQHVAVSELTIMLLERCVEAWNQTNGAFDPTIHSSMVALGYDRSILHLGPSDRDADTVRPAAGCDGIEINRNLRTICVPVGVALDVGGIGKGLAADVLYEDLRERGALGASVNIGGDLRVGGESPDGGGWPIGLGDPRVAGGPSIGDQSVLAVVHLNEGAVVTSTPRSRSWLRNGTRHHHLIDPRTGSSVETNICSVSIVCAQAWLGEAIAKHAILEEVHSDMWAATPLQVIESHRADGLVVRETHCETTAGLQQFLH